jgi:putative component of membrane protein insertase Oxa1/YidC/SpoIIIJ protein YidD
MMQTKRLKISGRQNNPLSQAIWTRCILGFLIFAFLVLHGCSAMPLAGSCSNDELSPISSMIGLYQGPLDHLSSVRFGGCPMYPNCSEYSLSAIEKHGMILGWLMTCDRLMRCGRDELELSPLIIADGKVKTFDSVDRNDEWLHRDQP